ncbi:MAG: hypothetical protein ACXVCY_04540 [Pseudobdellovibrionaceae bacterium]
MSVMLLPQNHTNAIVQFVRDRFTRNIELRVDEPGVGRHYQIFIIKNDFEEIGRVLYLGNCWAFLNKYKEQTEFSPETNPYRFSSIHYEGISLAQFFKALDSLEYQIDDGENPPFECIIALELIKELRSEAIRLVDGYTQAKWCIE